MGRMARETYIKELRRLEDNLLVLGSKVERALIEAVEILKRRDLPAARRLIEQDLQINKLRYAIEEDCLALIATQQPMAGDLRIIAAMLEITTELERMADYAKGIANINLMMGEGPFIKPLVDIPKMAEKAREMLHRSLEAFVRRDAGMARQICKEDDEVDGLYNQVYQELMSHIIADPTPRVIEQANFLLWTAHNLERAADRVTNICERVVFTVTGELGEICHEEPGLSGAIQ